MEIINQYSMLWGGVITLGLVTFAILRKGFKLRDGIILLVLAVGLFSGWVLMRPDQANTNELADFRSQIGQGKVVLVEMQSPY